MDWMRFADWAVGLGAWAGLAATAIVGIVLWRMWPVFTPRRDVDALRADVLDHGRRLDRGDARFQRLESHMEGLPRHTDLTALTTMVGEVSAQTREVAARLDGLAHLTTRLDRSLDLLTENELARGRKEGGPS